MCLQYVKNSDLWLSEAPQLHNLHTPVRGLKRLPLFTISHYNTIYELVIKAGMKSLAHICIYLSIYACKNGILGQNEVTCTHLYVLVDICKEKLVI